MSSDTHTAQHLRRGEADVGTATERALIALVALVALVVGAVGRLAGVDRMGAIGLVVFLLIGPGAAMLTWTTSFAGVTARSTVAFGLSYTVLCLGSMIEVGLHGWAPTATLTVISVLTAGVLSWSLAQDASALRAQASRVGAGLRHKPETLWLAALGVAVVACLVTAGLARSQRVPFWGFLGTVNPVWYVGIAVITGCATLGVVHRSSVVPAASAVAFAAVLALTPTLVYGTPRSQSAEKHIQLSQLITHTHHLQASQTIYNDWPGLFTASAWLQTFTGMHDLIALATWWPPLLAFFRVAVVRLLAERFVADRRLCWLIGLLTLVATPGGVDYYSPQSVGYVLGIAVLWLALDNRSSQLARLSALLAVACAVVVTHQLSPYIVGGALVVMVIFRQVRPWWVPALVLVPTFAWTAVHFDQVRHFISPTRVGSASNFQLPSQRNTGHPLFIEHAALYASAAALVVLGVLALVGLATGYRSLSNWGLAVAPLVGVLAVFINAYGNEGTFRAVFFAVPWLAILAARGLVRIAALDARLDRVAWPAVIAVVVALTLVGSFALDSSNVIRRGDRNFLSGIVAQARAHPDQQYIVISLGQGDFASPIVNKVRNLHLYRIVLSALASGVGDPASNLPADLAPLVGKPAITQLYVFSSPAVRAYAEEYGQATSGQIATLNRSLQSSSSWEPAFTQDGTLAFELDPAVTHALVR